MLVVSGYLTAVDLRWFFVEPVEGLADYELDLDDDLDEVPLAIPVRSGLGFGVNTGTRSGPVRLEVVVHPSEGWEDHASLVIDTPRPLSVQPEDEEMAIPEFFVPSSAGRYQVDIYATGRAAGRKLLGPLPDRAEPERYEFVFTPILDETGLDGPGRRFY